MEVIFGNLVDFDMDGDLLLEFIIEMFLSGGEIYWVFVVLIVDFIIYG